MHEGLGQRRQHAVHCTPMTTTCQPPMPCKAHRHHVAPAPPAPQRPIAAEDATCFRLLCWCCPGSTDERFSRWSANANPTPADPAPSAAPRPRAVQQHLGGDGQDIKYVWRRSGAWGEALLGVGRGVVGERNLLFGASFVNIGADVSTCRTRGTPGLEHRRCLSLGCSLLTGPAPCSWGDHNLVWGKHAHTWALPSTPLGPLRCRRRRRRTNSSSFSSIL